MLLTARAAVAQVSGLSKGQQWFVDNGLQLSGVIDQPSEGNPFHLATYQSMNYTTQTWAWVTDPNQLTMSWGRWVSDQNNLPPVGSESSFMSNLRHLNLGTDQGDEANLNDDTVRNQQVAFFNYAQSQPQFSKVLLWSNNFGGQVTDAALGDFISRAHPDMISFDSYPYAPNAQPAGGSPTNWYASLRQFRQWAITTNTALGTYRQTYASPSGSPQTRTVSQSELNLQTFAALAFNVKFLNDFTYNFDGGTLFNTPGDNTITSLGTFEKGVNQQVRNISPALSRLKPVADTSSDHTTSIMFVRGKHLDGAGSTVFNDMPGYMGFIPDPQDQRYSDWTFAANDPYLSGGFPLGATNLGAKNNGLPGDVIVSWFQPLHEWFDGDDWNNEKYLMVVNALADMNGTPADCPQTVTLQFNNNVNSQTLQVLDPATGVITNVDLPIVSTKRQYTLTLDGGSAVIFKFKDGAPFVGTLPPDAIWKTGATGTFSTGANWDIGTAPNGNYFAHFGTLTTGAGPYNVNFGSDVSSTGAFIHKDNTTWNLNNHTYTLNGFAGVDSLIVGMYGGENGQLTVSNGSLNVAASSTNFSQVGKASGATGIMTLASGAHWTNSPAVLIGKAGNGTVNVNTSATASLSDVYLGGSTTTFTTGSGVLNVNGGSVSISGTLKTWNTGTSSVNLSSGTLSVGTLDNNGNPSRFNFSGGTLDVTSSPITIGSTNHFTTLTVGAGKTLRVSGAGQLLSTSNTGTLNITGGRVYGHNMDFTTGAFTFTGGTIQIDSGPLKIGNSSNNSYAGAITGNGSLTKNGTGATTMTGSLSFTGSTNVSPGGTLVFATPHLTSSALNVSDNATAQFSSGGANVLRTGTINTNTSGRIDLTDNPAIIDYSGSSPAASIRAMIKSGYNNGAWNGPGFISTLAQTSSVKTAIGYAEASDLFNTFPTQYAGQTIDSTTIVTRYTVMGDADFSGKTDILDFNVLAANFGKSNMTWRQGDFDYSGTVDILDFNLLASTFGHSAPNSAPPAALRIDAARSSGDTAAIPLPSPLKLGAVGLLLAIFAAARSRQIRC